MKFTRPKRRERPDRHPLVSMAGVKTAFLILATGLLPLAATPFDDGLAAYRNADYTAAAESFQAAILEEESAAARHNLALSRFRQGKPAEAVWHLERAIQLAPFRSDYRFKLGALRSRLGLPEERPPWPELAAQTLTLSGWLLLGTISLWLGLALWILPRIAGARPSLPVKAGRSLFTLALLLALPAIAIHLQLRQRGIFIALEPVPLHAAPASAAPQVGNARPGERAQIKETHQNHFKIKTESNQTAWTPATTFRPLFE